MFEGDCVVHVRHVTSVDPSRLACAYLDYCCLCDGGQLSRYEARQVETSILDQLFKNNKLKTCMKIKEIKARQTCGRPGYVQLDQMRGVKRKSKFYKRTTKHSVLASPQEQFLRFLKKWSRDCYRTTTSSYHIGNSIDVALHHFKIG